MDAREKRGLRTHCLGLDSYHRLSVLVLGTLLTIVLMAVPARAGTSTGVWTALKNIFPVNSFFQNGGSLEMYVMTDGTVMVHANDQLIGGYKWYKLVPDSTGNYINGTWVKAASMAYARSNFSAVVLPNGKLMVVGGFATSTTGEIYDPVKDSWAQITYPGASAGGGAIALLPNGKVLVGDTSNTSTYLFDPSTDTWKQTGSKNYGTFDSSSRDVYTLLPNGDVLTVTDQVDFAPPGIPGFYQKTEKYDYRTELWTDAGDAPAWVRFAIASGPSTVLPNGQVYWAGTSESVIYTPSTNSWVLGPSLPATVSGLDDNVIPLAGVMAPDGHFLQIADGANSSGMRWVDYDYTTNTLTDTTSTIPAALASQLSSFPSPDPIYRTVVLPNGHILVSCDEGTIWDYGTSIAPQSSWRPTIAKITGGSGNNPIYTVTGTQLTGLWQGASTSEAGQASNYPIISLTGPGTSKNVVYATTSNWTPGVQTGTASSTVNFTLPTGLKSGSYQLSVIANGIASAPATFKYSVPTAPVYNYVLSQFVVGSGVTASTLTLTGDTLNNAVTISQQGKLVTVSGAGLTRIGTSATNSQSVSYSVPGDVVIVCNFNQPTTPANSDAVYLVAVQSSSTTITFGAGQGGNLANLTYCNIGSLNVDGGKHTTGSPNILTIVGTKISSHTYANIP